MSISFSEDEKVIVEKIKSYCLYQQRCIKEVKNKLFLFKVSPKFVNDLTKHLIENDYLNDERFSEMFIQGKLRIKKWGRIKLRYELKLKGIDAKIIDAKINKIKDEEYLNYFNQFSRKKIKSLKGTYKQKKISFINYFTYRGWEKSLIYEKLKDIN